MARNEVFITDWWLSPELYLRRPVSKEKNQETRIDVVLKTIASRGVNVRIKFFFLNLTKIYNHINQIKLI